MLALPAIGDQEFVKLGPDRVGELRRESLEGLLVGALARPADKPHKPVDRRTLDPLAAQQLADPRQKQRRALMLQRLLDQPRAEPVQRALAEGPTAGVGAYEEPVLDPRRRPDRVVKDRPRLDIERRTERSERFGRRARQILGDEPEPPHRPELQRDPELIRRAALRTDEREVLSSEREEAHDLAPLDALRPSLEPLDLGVGEKPAWRHGSEVDLQPLDRQQPVGIGRQAVATRGLQAPMPRKLGNEHQIRALPHHARQERMAQRVS